MDVNVSLTDDLLHFVEAKVAAGSYNSSSEVVREALRLMEKMEAIETEKLKRLREAWRAGIESDDLGELDFESLKKDARARFAATKA